MSMKHVTMNNREPFRNPGALRRWMLAGPEITRIIAEFEDQLTTEHVDETRHHEQQGAVQKTFFEQVTALDPTSKNLVIHFWKQVVI